MKRRQFIQTASATSALGAMALMSGCATIGGANGPKVVVVGGGVAAIEQTGVGRQHGARNQQITTREFHSRFLPLLKL